MDFGINGLVQTDFFPGENRNQEAGALAIQPSDGFLVLAGASGKDCALARYTPDGDLDPDFGSSGLVTTDLGSDGMILVDCEINDVAIADDDRIIAVGRSVALDGDFLVIRYLQDGSLDPSFGNGGIVRTDVTGMLMNDAALALALDDVGRVVAVGDTTLDAKQSFSVARYLVPEPSSTLLSLAALATIAGCRLRRSRINRRR